MVNVFLEFCNCASKRNGFAFKQGGRQSQNLYDFLKKVKEKKILCKRKILKTISLSYRIKSGLTGSGLVYLRIHKNYDSATNFLR